MVVIITAHYNEDSECEWVGNSVTMKRAIEIWRELGKSIFQEDIIGLFEDVRHDDIKTKLERGRHFGLRRETRSRIHEIIQTNDFRK